MTEQSMVGRVADAVLDDLTDRKGFRHFWDNCDEGIQAEVRDAIGRAAIEAMRPLLESLKREHQVVDSDCWFSCPASGECCDEDAGTKCNCGADEHNALIAAALSEPEAKG